MKAAAKAVVTRRGIFDMQVCVPVKYSSNQVTKFANTANPCGTTNGWIIRKAGDPALNGCKERVPCDDRAGFVHIMLDA